MCKKMCKTEKKKLRVIGVFCTEHFEKRVIGVYPFQEKKTPITRHDNYTLKNANYPLKLSV